MDDMFLVAVNEYLSDRESVIRELQFVQKTMTSTDFLDEDIRTAERELEILSDMIRHCIMGNASNTLTETEYTEKHTELCRKFEEKEKEITAMKGQREQMEENRIAIGGMLFELQEMEMLPIAFDESLWNAIVENITVHSDGSIVFRFKDGKEVTVAR